MNKKLKIVFLDPESGAQDSQKFFSEVDSINAVGASSVAENAISPSREIYFIQQRTKSNIEVVSSILDHNPDVIAVTSYSYNFPNSLEIVRQVYDSMEAKPIVVYGGIHTTLATNESFVDSDFLIDYIVLGEGEITFDHLLSSIESNDLDPYEIDGIAFYDSDIEMIVKNRLRDRVRNLDSLKYSSSILEGIMDHPKSSLCHIPMSQIVNAGISTSRGCDHNCEFCTTPDFWYGGRMSRKSAVEIANEFEYLHDNFGVNYVMITDEKFVSRKDGRFVSICEEFKRRGMKDKVRYSCFSTLGEANPEVLELLYESGCSYINYGVEAVDIDVLKKMHKGINIRPNSREIFRMTREANIFGSALFMIGAPYSTLQSIEKVRSFVEYNADVIDKIRVSFYTPFQGTEGYYRAVENRLFLNNVVNYEDGSVNLNMFTTKVPLICPPKIVEELGFNELSIEDRDVMISSFFEECRLDIYRSFYVNHKYYENCLDRIQRDPELIKVFAEWFQKVDRTYERFTERMPNDLKNIVDVGV